MLAYKKQPKLHPLSQCLLCPKTLQNVSQGNGSATNTPHPAHTRPFTSYSEQMHNWCAAEGVLFCADVKCELQRFVRVRIREMLHIGTQQFAGISLTALLLSMALSQLETYLSCLPRVTDMTGIWFISYVMLFSVTAFSARNVT